MIKLSLFDAGHNFRKANLVTQGGKNGSYDVYKCDDCGLEGKRYGLNDYITLKSVKNCTRKTEQQPAPSPDILGKVKLTKFDGRSWGLSSGDVVDRVPCPVEYMEKYANDVWVFSPARNEPMRLMGDEYQDV